MSLIETVKRKLFRAGKAVEGGVLGILDGETTEAGFYGRQLDSFEQVLQSIGAFATEETPDELPALQSVLGDVLAAIKCERAIVTAKARSVDDISDISIRWNAMQKGRRAESFTSEDVDTAKAAVEDIRIQKIRDGGKNAARLDVALTDAKEKLRTTQTAHAAKLRELLESREKFNRFKANRLRHAFGNLGTCTVEALRSEIAKLEQAAVTIGRCQAELGLAGSGSEGA